MSRSTVAGDSTLGSRDLDRREQAERALSPARSWHERVADLAAQGALQLALRIVAVGSFGGRQRSDYRCSAAA